MKDSYAMKHRHRYGHRTRHRHGHVDTCNVQNIEHSTGVVSCRCRTLTQTRVEH